MTIFPLDLPAEILLLHPFRGAGGAMAPFCRQVEGGLLLCGTYLCILAYKALDLVVDPKLR